MCRLESTPIPQKIARRRKTFKLERSESSFYEITPHDPMLSSHRACCAMVDRFLQLASQTIPERKVFYVILRTYPTKYSGKLWIYPEEAGRIVLNPEDKQREAVTCLSTHDEWFQALFKELPVNPMTCAWFNSYLAPEPFYVEVKTRA